MTEQLYILNIETSGLACTVSLSVDGKHQHLVESKGEWKHSRELTLLVQSILEQAGIQMSQLSAIAVSSGPGSYTGLRVGLSAAKAMCYALDKPLIAIPTLKIIANAKKSSLNSFDYIIASIDARRDEIYYQVFNKRFEALDEADNLILEENSFKEYEKALFCGDAADKASKLIKTHPSIDFDHFRPSAEFMADLAFAKFRSGSFEDLAYFSPFYLKSPNITKSKKPLF